MGSNLTITEAKGTPSGKPQFGEIVIQCEGTPHTYELLNVFVSNDDRIGYEYTPRCSCGYNTILLGAPALIRVEIF